MYKSKQELIRKDGTPSKFFNKGWRVNRSIWNNMFLHPNRGILRLKSALDSSKEPYQLNIVVFDPEWRGRFGNCPDGSPVMFMAEVTGAKGTKCYIDIQGSKAGDKGANFKLYAEKAEYCQRNNIPLLVLYSQLRSDEMEFLIKQLIRRN